MKNRHNIGLIIKTMPQLPIIGLIVCSGSALKEIKRGGKTHCLLYRPRI
jgi:hypothetical protein